MSARGAALPLPGMPFLVNAAHPLPGEAQGVFREAAGGVRLHEAAARALAALIQAAGGGPGAAERIVLVSGLRSRAEQQAIWDECLAEKGSAFTHRYVALPGCSEHETGLAVDLALDAPFIDPIRPLFPRTGVCGAFRRLAAQYGFIERYRAGKQALTGIAAEPWHFRYVGPAHALLLQRSGLCLEEYFPFLDAEPRAVALPGGGAQVCRVTDACRAQAMARAGCEVRPDNAGGWVVTQQ